MEMIDGSFVDGPRLVAAARHVPAAPGPRHIFDTVNTSVLDHAGSGRALVEAGSTPVRFDKHLETQRYDDFGGTLPGSFTAHPRRDPATGELHALCYEATDPKRVRYNVVDVDGRVQRSVTIPVSHGPLIHDCAITQRYVVVMELPLTLSMRTVLAGHSFPIAGTRSTRRGSDCCRAKARRRISGGSRSPSASCSTPPTPMICRTAAWRST